MGSHMNFKNFGDATIEGSGAKPLGDFPLARQSSIYALTFDELQNTLLGGAGKDFGSMNMDELLKNIWTAEETQAQAMAMTMTASGGGGGEGSVLGGNLQRQGSLTLPRTLSQKTVDEVWRDLFKDSGVAKDGSSSGCVGSNMLQTQRQQTLGEITLEEFLARAGVVREDMQQIGKPDNVGFYGDFSPQSNNTGLVLGFQQASRNHGLFSNNNAVPNQAPSLALNVGGVRSSQQQLQQPQQHQPHQQPQQRLPHQQQPIFPKQANLAFASPLHLVNTAQLASQGARGSILGNAHPPMNNNLVQAGGLQSGGMGMVGLGTVGVTVAAGSPASQVSSDVIAKSSADRSSLSPVPYVFGRGRKCGAALEKVVERRHKRMIKNRESAARSRARKQAYTLELEAEVEQLKEVNKELERKQAEIMEMQKNQLLEKMNRQCGGKRQCLRRTLTGPW